MDEVEGLENKIGKISVGDVILLHSKEINVVGYVADYNPRQVKLSHENPHSTMTKYQVYNRNFRGNIGRGDKWYNLVKFDSFKILMKYKPEPAEEQKNETD
ncbi:hypothetical protein KY348_00990 [Candidatus Woesearchaeota archaeon]|nr:hypothetical protein [Candidatus Woesearchaeota archaeon]